VVYDHLKWYLYLSHFRTQKWWRSKMLSLMRKQLWCIQFKFWYDKSLRYAHFKISKYHEIIIILKVHKFNADLLILNADFHKMYFGRHELTQLRKSLILLYAWSIGFAQAIYMLIWSCAHREHHLRTCAKSIYDDF
jgi:hypothetical protein